MVWMVNLAPVAADVVFLLVLAKTAVKWPELWLDGLVEVWAGPGWFFVSQVASYLYLIKGLCYIPYYH